ncbi:hypothetical protein D3X11_03150 [Streptococcus sp. X16XC17]|uniref:methyltransferase RsmF C-terminal domain-like protein n=1 Tax=Streptococcus sp. X13SY08 TaxID=1676616 RepID=UPI0009E91ECB|nr:hypothetical protein D3X11_03150 [Streptococcus sp. X16XC17]
MDFPQDFIEKYSRLLGPEAPPFLASFEAPAVSGFRTNPLKEQQGIFADKIPDMPWSYYGKVSGKSPQHVTGLVYSQEPAAQVVGQVAINGNGLGFAKIVSGTLKNSFPKGLRFQS